MTPQRYQRKRTRGYKLPPHTKCVDRTTKWGNPFKVVDDKPGYSVTSTGGVKMPFITKKAAIQLSIEMYISWLYNTPQGNLTMQQAKKELKGYNLACYCSLESECHGSVLLKIANED